MLDLDDIRGHFPSLDRPAIFLDNPGGTQIARQCLERMQAYLLKCNANYEGAFATSKESDALIDETHQATADFLNAALPEEIVFGPNMTTLTFHISRSIARLLQPGDEILVTHLDHDANISPWLYIAEDHGYKITWIDFDVEDCTLKMDQLERALERKPKLVAFGYASNAVGTINPAEQITQMAHAAGALVFVDAVHYTPHGPIDVQSLDCDFLVCSAYKFFGPHLGILYGRYAVLDSLPAYRVRPAAGTPPGKFETGTQNHEGIAGLLGTLEYLEWIGNTFGADHAQKYSQAGFTGRKLALKSALAAMRAYEYELSRALLTTLQGVPGLRLYGITDIRQLEKRVPTFSFRLEGLHPRRVAELLDQEGIYVWDGNYYALAVTERLGVEQSGGMVRVGAVHYNTLEEIGRLGEALGRIAAGGA